MAVARTGTMEGRTSVVVDKREIPDAAYRLSVNPHVIEKDNAVLRKSFWRRETASGEIFCKHPTNTG